ncbi:unnamed protein product [Rhizoctonia solani]|uniref:Fungal-specific transcription factor domain protein n=1 Tax=Rhizoctonia solani TaxID=456999 RepID=A0A8H3GBC9_9AGAM|nr:unnamed protein product [Rhizoctonia solani]
MSQRKISCTTCATRQRQRDGIQSICCHRNSLEVECGRYPPSRISMNGLLEPRNFYPPPHISSMDTPALSVLPARNCSMPSRISDISRSEPMTSSPPDRACAQSSLGLPLIENSYPLVPPAPPPQHDLTPLYPSIPRNPLAHKKDVRQSMTPGQASLFDALFSLARPEDGDNTLDPVSPSSSQNLGYECNSGVRYHNQTDLEDSCDVREVATRLSNPLVLDRNVESNTLAFVLQSYALWIRQFLFEPIRVLPLCREYIHHEYAERPETRWRMLITSNVVRSITGSTEYNLKDLQVLQSHMHEGFSKAASSFGFDRKTNMVIAHLAMGTTYEFISVLLVVSPLPDVLKSMQAVAPIFRHGCPDPDDRQVNLPSLLLNINVCLKYYATLDIILGAILGRPMYFRYDTTFPAGVHESIFNIENGPGLRWKLGIPDRLVVTLARMNALFEDFGSGVDSKVIQELELEIKGFKSIIIATNQHELGMARLVVQESWRQVAYIYLYMGLCGCDSHDARVIKANDEFLKLLKGTKSGRFPDSFLVILLPILGIATRHLDDRGLLKSRMLGLPECVRPGTTGSQLVRMLEFMWSLADESNRPTIWSDLRLAALYVAGV